MLHGRIRKPNTDLARINSSQINIPIATIYRITLAKTADIQIRSIPIIGQFNLPDRIAPINRSPVTASKTTNFHILVSQHLYRARSIRIFNLSTARIFTDQATNSFIPRNISRRVSFGYFSLIQSNKPTNTFRKVSLIKGHDINRGIAQLNKAIFIQPDKATNVRRSLFNLRNNNPHSIAFSN